MDNKDRQEREYYYQKGYHEGYRAGMEKYFNIVVDIYQNGIRPMVIQCPRAAELMKARGES